MGRALLRIRPWQRRAVLEVAIDRPGEMRTQAATVRPQIVVVTAIASDHWMSFHTLEATRDEKANILRTLPPDGVAILNADDPHVRWMATQTRARVVLAGEAEDAEIRATDVELDWPHGMRFTVHVDGEMRHAHVRLVGRHMVFPALAAIAVAREERIPLDAAIAAVGEVEPTPGRMQPMVLANGAVVLRDDFKGTTDTFAAALETFEAVPAGRRIVVLGAIAEETGTADYRAAALRAAAFADRAIFVGSRKNFAAYRAGSLAGGMPRSHMAHVRHWDEAYALLSADLRSTDAVLIKGRWQQALGRIGLALAGRDVQCRADPCPFKQMLCDVCPFLEQPFDGLAAPTPNSVRG